MLALVELEEGVRMVGRARRLRPEEVEIGMPVRVDFERIDDELTLPGLEARHDSARATSCPSGGCP